MRERVDGAVKRNSASAFRSRKQSTCVFAEAALKVVVLAVKA